MNIKNLIHRVLVWLHLKEDYGFTRLTFRGKPIILRDDMPVDNLGFVNEETARVRVLNWKTGKVGKLMTFRQFYRWVDSQNKKLQIKPKHE